MPQSHLERTFEYLWTEYYPNIDLTAEMRLIPGRRFRFDYVHEESKTAIEINGGNWGRGRHTRAGALNSEYEKILLAALEGYQVVCLSGDQLERKWLSMVARLIKRRLKERV